MHRAITFALFAVLTPVAIAAAQETARDRPDPYDRLFTLPGVTFSAEQQQRVDDLRRKMRPKLIELQEKRDAILTPEQIEARRKAFRAARDAGKNLQEARAEIEAAIGWTEAQKGQLAAVQRERSELMTGLRTDLVALLTDAQKSKLGGRAGGNSAGRRAARRRPTHADVSYGPHARNVMDVWLAESTGPAPVLVSIHGGGFRGGNKGVDSGLLEGCLEAGISVVAITYRLSGDAIAPAQFHDAARAIQFVRHNAKQWNIDPERIAATGGSAGAGLSLWLGFHDDLADAKSDDQILRHSTRLSCMAVYNGQTSYDPRFIRELFPGTDTYKHSALAELYDVDLDRLDEAPPEKVKLFEEVSALPHLTKDDPPALLCYGGRIDSPITSQGVGIHHPRFGKVLDERMDELGIECEVKTGTRRGSDEWVALMMAFVKKGLDVE